MRPYNENMRDYAEIVTLEKIEELHDSLGKIVCTSGGFDPIHPGHASCIIESGKLGDTLIVVVNGDSFLRAKKGRQFMDLNTRCRIVSCIRSVDYVVPFEIEKDKTVCVALERIRPHIFTKGGDRTDYSNIPEWEVCKRIGTEIVPQVGLPKMWSSSDFLNDWVEYFVE
jgi:D-beta-D-heptose 7-phosphate kinase/D-beta-D-heptose 1-phosphate adenosyltransferase